MKRDVGGRVQEAHLSSLDPAPDLPHLSGRKEEEREEREGSHRGAREPQGSEGASEMVKGRACETPRSWRGRGHFKNSDAFSSIPKGLHC